MKKRVVHTRLPEELFDKIVESAKKNRTTVSGLMRNLLEDFLDISEDFSDIATDKVRNMFFGKQKDDKGELIGYQPITLVKDTQCENTGKKMKKGAQAYLAFYENCQKGIIVCKECVNKGTVEKKK